MKINLNKNKTYQIFEGFGASGAWWAQYAGGWKNTDPESGIPVADRIVQLLWSKTDGIGLRTYRYNLGAGSKESGRGTYSDEYRRAECFEDKNGKYDFSKDENAVYMMKKAADFGADEIILFVNSPIERLTKNGKAHLNKNAYFRTNLSKKNYDAFAKYCVDVTEHFVKAGLPIKYLSPVNEPLWIWNGSKAKRIAWINYGSLLICFTGIGLMANIMESLTESGFALIILGLIMLGTAIFLEQQRRRLIHAIKAETNNQN